MSVMEDERVMTSGEIAFDLPSVVEERNLNLRRDDTAWKDAKGGGKNCGAHLPWLCKEAEREPVPTIREVTGLGAKPHFDLALSSVGVGKRQWHVELDVGFW